VCRSNGNASIAPPAVDLHGLPGLDPVIVQIGG